MTIEDPFGDEHTSEERRETYRELVNKHLHDAFDDMDLRFTDLVDAVVQYCFETELLDTTDVHVTAMIAVNLYSFAFPFWRLNEKQRHED